MIGRVLDALAASRIRRVVAVSSPHTPATTAAMRTGHVGPSPERDTADLSENRRGSVDPSENRRGSAGLACDVVVGSGEGYVEDLNRGLDAVDGPALTVTSDLPLLRSRDVGDAVSAAIDSADAPSVDAVSVCVPVSVKRDLGASVDTRFTHDGLSVAPTGLNVVADGDDAVVVRRRESLAVNVNRPRDLELARRLAADE